MEMFTIDLTEVATVAVTLVAGVVSVLAGYAIRWLRARIGLDGLVSDEVVRSYLDPAIDAAAEFAIARIGTGWARVETRSELVATAVNYVITHVPEALDHLGLDRPALEEMVEVRLSRLAAPAGPGT